MSVIKVMDDILANKIAAGEVVEKCVSVVKELVENSIDAKATEIKIELEDAGVKKIKVSDNGCGMDREDAVIAFQRHATSKLKNEEDLYRIETLGFRGEALASIASVSRVILKTCCGGVGTTVVIAGGKIESVSDSDSRVGTVITISDLFYNTPARLKHLKSLYTELANVTDYVNKISLSHSEIKFSLTNNGNVILNTDGSNNLLKVISNIYGIDIAKKMIEVNSEDDDYTVFGYISLPEVMRSSRNSIITLVNGRVVRNTEINRVINDSYHGYKPDSRYPIVVLKIEVDPSLIDVNIHPTKMDIKFSKMDEILNLIEKMIRKALKQQLMIPHIDITKTIPSFEDGFEKKEIIKPKYEEITLNLERIGEVEEEYNPVKVVDESIDMSDVDESSLFEIIESSEKLPELYPIGVIHGTYIVCQNEKGMYLVDQHAACERVNFEYYHDVMAKPKVDSIALLIPITIELSNREYIIIKENFSILEKMGFEISDFGINSIIIKAHPIWLPKGREEEMTRLIISNVIEREKNFSLSKFNEHIAATISCKASVRANDKITLEEMENLINNLRKCRDPFHCAHGRPSIVFFSSYDLQKMFKRTGFC